VFVTRLHARYDANSFPEDLALQETGDRTNYQARYVLRHPWKGNHDCEGAKAYRAQLRERRQQRARNLSDLTGWPLADIRAAWAVDADWSTQTDRMKWWDRLWTK
jgi:hypothetical protein